MHSSLTMCLHNRAFLPGVVAESGPFKGDIVIVESGQHFVHGLTTKDSNLSVRVVEAGPTHCHSTQALRGSGCCTTEIVFSGHSAENRGREVQAPPWLMYTY